MPHISEYTPGTFCWIDLMSPDVDASVGFYTAVFGWDAEDQHDDDGNRIYTMFRKDGRDVAGLGGQQPGTEGMPAAWNSYVATDDLDKTTELVESAGGRVVMPPMDVMDSGRMSIYQAPDGAFISAWQAGQHIGAQVVNEHATWGWNELMTREIDTVKAFYADVFGWTYGEQDMGPAGMYYLATVDDREMGGLMAMPDEVSEEVPNYWGVYFYVDDLDAAVAKVAELDGELVTEPISTPGVGTFLMAQDPQGGFFTLMMPEDQPDES